MLVDDKVGTRAVGPLGSTAAGPAVTTKWLKASGSLSALPLSFHRQGRGTGRPALKQFSQTSTSKIRLDLRLACTCGRIRGIFTISWRKLNPGVDWPPGHRIEAGFALNTRGLTY